MTKPTSKPAVFDARTKTAELAAEDFPPFPFVGMDGKTYELPNPYMLDPVEVRKALGIKPGQSFGPDDFDALDGSQQFELMESLAPEAWAALNDMPLAVMNATVVAWSEHSGFQEDEEGKERSGSSPRNRAERRSKQTSRSGGSTSTRSRSAKSKAASGS